MPTLQNRSRIVTFRLSEEEYERLQVVAVARGVRSISEFVRMAVCWILTNSHRHVWDLMSDVTPRSAMRVHEDLGFDVADEDDARLSPRAAQHRDAIVLAALKSLNENIASLSRMLEEARRPGVESGEGFVVNRTASAAEGTAPHRDH